MLVGGMPQAVSAYLETNNFRQVDLVKRDILNLYEDDFRKIDPSGKASLLFRGIPGELNKNASRYQVSSVLSNSRAEDVIGLIREMENSKCILMAYHANAPNVGLAANKDQLKFKMFMSDTGLFTTAVFADKDFTDNIIYEKLLSAKLSANLGYLYENMVAQILTAKGNELYYHTFPTEKGNHLYEIDFLLSAGNKIVPIEVKSGNYTKHESIDRFSEKYSSRVGRKILLHCKDRREDQALECLPIYFAPFL